jgi:GTPase
MPDPTDFVSGFVSILGRPNAGKSTLLNAIVGMKVSIVADKPQTTQTTIQGVWTTPNSQVVFLDTPGIHRSDTPFNQRMMMSVSSALDERDLLIYVADSTHSLEQEDFHALDLFRQTPVPAFLVLNKIDKLRQKQILLTRITQYKAKFEFEEYFPISALTGDGLEVLQSAIVKKMKPGPAYFPEDDFTDQPARFMAGELIREKVLRETRQEVPHSVAVIVDSFDEKKPLVRIAATIYVEREGQKGIIIGAKGSMLKKIGTQARLEIEKLVGRNVFLDLNVKVRENWREHPEFLNALDWRNERTDAE